MKHSGTPKQPTDTLPVSQSFCNLWTFGGSRESETEVRLTRRKTWSFGWASGSFAFEGERIKQQVASNR